MTYEYKQFLAHHGIKGQKWGERRYQNEDGTLTPEGRRRYGTIYGSQMNNIAKVLKRDDLTESRRAELNEEYSRLQKLGESSRTKRKLQKAAIGLAAAHLLTGGKSTKFLAKGALKGARAVYQAASKVKNSKAVHTFMSKQKYKKMGAIMLKKNQFRVSGLGLPSGR